MLQAWTLTWFNSRLRHDVQRLSINFMGCYAAFNAIKAGDAFCKADGDSTVLVVCVELCGIHFQKQASEDNMLANALFADGAAALMMQSNARSRANLTPTAFHNALSFTADPQMALARRKPRVSNEADFLCPWDHSGRDQKTNRRDAVED